MTATEVTVAHPVCTAMVLHRDGAVCALVDGVAVAVFVLPDGTLAAIDDVDPCTGVSVLSRGIIGDHGGVVTVASPLLKHRFDLHTGRCLDDPEASVAVHRAEVVDGQVWVTRCSSERHRWATEP